MGERNAKARRRRVAKTSSLKEIASWRLCAFAFLLVWEGRTKKGDNR